MVNQTTPSDTKLCHAVTLQLLQPGQMEMDLLKKESKRQLVAKELTALAKELEEQLANNARFRKDGHNFGSESRFSLILLT